MEVILYLIPPTILFGIIILWSFFWAMKNKQYEDIDGEAERIIHIDETAANDDEQLNQ